MLTFAISETVPTFAITESRILLKCLLICLRLEAPYKSANIMQCNNAIQCNVGQCNRMQVYISIHQNAIYCILRRRLVIIILGRNQNFRKVSVTDEYFQARFLDGKKIFLTDLTKKFFYPNKFLIPFF